MVGSEPPFPELATLAIAPFKMLWQQHLDWQALGRGTWVTTELHLLLAWPGEGLWSRLRGNRRTLRQEASCPSLCGRGEDLTTIATPRCSAWGKGKVGCAQSVSLLLIYFFFMSGNCSQYCVLQFPWRRYLFVMDTGLLKLWKLLFLEIEIQPCIAYHWRRKVHTLEKLTLC